MNKGATVSELGPPFHWDWHHDLWTSYTCNTNLMGVLVSIRQHSQPVTEDARNKLKKAECCKGLVNDRWNIHEKKQNSEKAEDLWPSGLLYSYHTHPTQTMHSWWVQTSPLQAGPSPFLYIVHKLGYTHLFVHDMHDWGLTRWFFVVLF